MKIYEPSDLTLQPVVAGPNCPTRCLSNLVDLFIFFFFYLYSRIFFFFDLLLKPFLIHIKSYIKDNLDFLAKCSGENK